MLESKMNSSFEVNKTGLIYDPIMLGYECEFDKTYPEKPDRIKKPYERCQFYGLTEKCIRLPGRMCTDEEVEKYHTSRVNQMLKDSTKMTEEELLKISANYDSMYFSPGSSDAARFALGSSLDLLDSVMTGKVDNGFAIIRPPGHHAMCDEPNGYCYFNNAVITAKTALEKYGLNRVLIVDWDVHHGQGVQYAFYDDPRVLYFSMHRYDYGQFWPNLRQGDFDYIGDKDGKGYNINVPLNKIGLGNSEYSAAFYNLLLPIAYEYKPELVILASGYDAAIGCHEFKPDVVIVSGGFDSAIGDQKGRMNVTPAGYAHFINALSCLSNGKLCVLLEGGYCIKSLSEGVALSVRALLGYPTPRVEDYLKPDPIFVKTLMNLTAVLRPYWKCLQNINSKDSMELSDYLETWDKQYRQNIEFYNTENPPTEFDVMQLSPEYTVDEIQRLDKEIDVLIGKTDLHVPVYKTCCSLNEDERKQLNINEFKDQLLLNLETDSNKITKVLESICKRESTNGFVFLNSSESSHCLEQLVEAVTYQKTLSERIRKILVVNISNDKIPEHLTKDESILFVSTMNKEKSNERKNVIDLNFESDTEYLTGFLRILLPIAYQFNPDLVAVYVGNSVSTSQSELSLNCLTHVLKLLCALANGNTIVAFEECSNMDNMCHAVNRACNILLGKSCEELSALIPDEKLQIAMKEKIQELKSNWDCFQFNESLF